MADLTHVAFLRGMNVGGHRLTNAELAAVFVDLGFTSVVPYQAAGNVMLACDRAPDAEAIEAALAAHLGYAVPTIVRSASEIRAIAGSEPFDAALGTRKRGEGAGAAARRKLHTRSGRTVLHRP